MNEACFYIEYPHLKMASQVGEVGAVLVADGTDGGGRLGHDGVHVVWKQIKRNSALVANLAVNLC